MMNIRIVILLLILNSLFSCNNDNELDFALIQTGDVTNIDSTGATFHARISDLGNLNIINYGFVWSTESNPDIDNSEKYIITDVPTTGIISEKISTTLKDTVTYYVRAFIRNDNYITYGKEVTFTSLGSSAPEITDFYPKTGNINDTLFILGNYFSYIAKNNTVYIGNYKADVINAVQDTIAIQVPSSLDTLSSIISVSIFNNEVEFSDPFNLIPPVLDSFNDTIGTYGSQITIEGNNFLSNQESLKVFFDSVQSEITNVENESLTVIVPDSLNTKKCTISVSMNNLCVNTTDSFTLEPISIIDFSPKVITTGETITLTGNNFSSILENNIVMIGGVKAEVTNASAQELEVTVPLQDDKIYPERNVTVSIEVAQNKRIYSDSLLINDQWFRRNDCPLDYYPGDYTIATNNAVVINNKAYIGLCNSDILYSFNPENNKWNQLTTFPGETRIYGVMIAIDNKLYFGMGYNAQSYNDFWEYDPELNTWDEKEEFPGSARYWVASFSIDNYGYVGTGNFTRIFYKYDPTVDEWSEIEPISFTDRNGRYKGIQYAVGVTIQSEGYVGLGDVAFQGDENDQFYKYNPSTSEWTKINNFPVHAQYGHYGGIAYSYENEGFFKSNDYPDKLWKYNSTTGLWSEECDIPTSLESSSACFCIDGVAYFINNDKQMWEYDPNR